MLSKRYPLGVVGNPVRAVTSLAKISRPSSSGVFPRHRLFRLLDHSRAQPVIWIAGPPGSGKTALVASYLDARKLPCLWYQVDEGDADIASFFYYLGLAAKRAAPRKRLPLPLLTPEYYQGIPAFTRRYFEDLFSRLALNEKTKGRNGETGPRRRGKTKKNFSPAQFTIVLDNYQEVPEGSLFHEVVREGVTQAPDGVNIILISRRSPSDVFVRLKANRLIGMIGWKELRFTLDESREMVRRWGHKSMPLEQLRQLHEIADGWAAGIVLLIEGMKEKADESILPPEVHGSEDLFHYFAKEAFNRTDPEVQDFLLRTSFLPQMSSEMAKTLTGIQGSQDILSDLTRKNYFTERQESETVFYQYHPLFREFLQALARQIMDSTTLSRVKKEAAGVLQLSGQIEAAMELLIAERSWPDVIPLILLYAQDLIRQGREQTLEGWIRNIPEAAFEGEPWLLYWTGICRLPFSPSQSGDFFEKAFKLFRAKGDKTGTFLSLSGLLDSTSYDLGNFKPLDRTIALLDEVLEEFKPLLSLETGARLTASMLMAIVLRQPHRPDFEIWANKAFSLSQRSQDITSKIQTFQALVSHWLLAGELLKAESVLDSFRKVIHSTHVAPLAQIILRDLEAFYYWLTGAFEENQKAVTEGLELASETGVHLIDIYLLGHGAAGVLSSGDVEAARAYIKEMALRLDNVSAWGKTFYYMISTWASLLQRDLSKALFDAEWCMGFAAEAGMPQTEAVEHIGYAIVLHELRREEEAADHLVRGRNLAQSSKAPIAEFMCFLAEARFAFDRADDQAGLTSLRKALSMGRGKRYVNTYYWQPSVMANLCKKALEAGIEAEYVQSLIRKRRLMPDPPPYDCEHWPWPLKINMLGQFEIAKEGEPMQFLIRSPRKVLSLLKALIAFGRNGASEEQLTDVLWPEAQGDTAKQAFETTLHRLRQLLGNEKFILLREGHLNLNRRYCMVDAHAFEQLLEQAEASRSIPLMEKALALYQGTFLGDDPGEPWALSYRERLRSKFLRSVRKLGSYFQEREEMEKAIEYYQKGLEVDSLAEEFYRQLMICYQIEGRKAEALATYNRCRDMLQSVLGIEPSPATQTLHDTLKKKTRNV